MHVRAARPMPTVAGIVVISGWVRRNESAHPFTKYTSSRGPCQEISQFFRTLKCHKLSLRRIYISAHEITRKHHLLLFQGQGRILAQGRLFRKLRQAEGNRPRAHLRQPRRKIRARRQGPVQDNRGRRKLRRDRRRRPRPLHARRRLHRLHPDRPPVARQEVEQGRRPQLRHLRLLQVHTRRLQGKSPRAQGRLLPCGNPPRRKREQLRLPLPNQKIR